MNKNVCYIVMISLAISCAEVVSAECPFSNALQQEAQYADEDAKEVVIDGDFEDFFTVDSDEKPRSVIREKKDPPSRAQIIMMQIGIKIALTCESIYTTLYSLWSAFLSLFTYEA